MPVDWEALKLPDYPEIIKHPMDLGTVKTQLETGIYESDEEFADDVRLVWANALRYNQPASDICVMAQELSNVFEAKYAKSKTGIEESNTSLSPKKQPPLLGWPRANFFSSSSMQGGSQRALA